MPDCGADLIFDQPNDLVVDSATTHHCSYFQDLRVLSWLDARLR
ncbi:hypothetical protein [Roseateles sp. P5_E4]